MNWKSLQRTILYSHLPLWVAVPLLSATPLFPAGVGLRHITANTLTPSHNEGTESGR